MQEVRKKRHGKRGRRLGLLPLLGVLLAAALAFALWDRAGREPAGEPPEPDTAGVLRLSEAEEIRSVSIRFGGGEWTADCVDGRLILPDGTGVSPAVAGGLILAARNVGWTEALTEDDAWQEHLADFGLDEPYLSAVYTYTDGQVIRLRVGDRLAGEQAARYLWIEGEKRLLAIDTGTAADLSVDEAHLREARQPGLEKNRIDRVRVRDASGERAWTLEGLITDADAADRWYLTEPFRYPADSDRMDSLRENLALFRVGAYVCEDTPENRAEYGLDQPRAEVEVHMAAGQVLVTDGTGAASAQDRAEETVTLLIGAAKSDMVDYVCCRGQIGIASRFTHQSFTGLKAEDSLTRYLVLTSLSSLRRLTIRSGGEKTVWEVRYDLTGEDAETVYSDDGAAGQVTRNGVPVSWEAFESAYGSLLLVTASGRLPADWTPEGEPVSEWIFETGTGVTRTLAFVPFDPLHQAVLVDGKAVFYLIDGGMGEAELTRPE